jgi:hypothetical protein
MTMPSDSHEVVLRLTGGELEALDAVRSGVGALAARGLDRESAVIAAVELALVRLVEDFDLPEPDAATVRAGLASLRSAWSRGNACLT